MINIDTKSREPIYLQIEKQIIKLIGLGVYEKGSSLPSVRAMACDLGINPNTVARAYKNLEQKDIIYTIVGKGVFVNDSNQNRIKSIATEKFYHAVVEAKNSGIELQETIDIVNEVWREQKND